MPFQLLFPNADHALHAGMYGQVRLPLSNDRPTLTVPSSALVFNAQGAQIVTVRNKQIHLQPVQVGRDLGTELEIPDGLAADDQIVPTPSSHLIEGLAVNPVSAPTTAPATGPAAK